MVVSGEMSERQSIDPTYNHAETGDRFSIETRLNDRRIEMKSMSDPFVHHRVTVGWLDALRSLLRHGRVVITVIVGGDAAIVEDVLELNDDYAGQHGSSRRREFKAQINDALGRLGRD